MSCCVTMNDLADAQVPAAPVARGLTIAGLSPTTALLYAAGGLLLVGGLVALAARPSGATSNPPRRPKKWNGRYYSKKPIVGDKLLPKPYGMGKLTRKMEKHKTLKGRARGMLRWIARKEFGVELSDRQVEAMLGKAPSDLRGVVQGVKRADIKRAHDRVFFSSSRGLHAMPGTKAVAVEPAKGKVRTRKPKGGAKKAKMSKKARKKVA